MCYLELVDTPLVFKTKLEDVEGPVPGLDETEEAEGDEPEAEAEADEAEPEAEAETAVEEPAADEAEADDEPSAEAETAEPEAAEPEAAEAEPEAEGDDPGQRRLSLDRRADRGADRDDHDRRRR